MSWLLKLISEFETRVDLGAQTDVSRRYLRRPYNPIRADLMKRVTVYNVHVGQVLFLSYLKSFLEVGVSINKLPKTQRIVASVFRIGMVLPPDRGCEGQSQGHGILGPLSGWHRSWKPSSATRGGPYASGCPAWPRARRTSQGKHCEYLHAPNKPMMGRAEMRTALHVMWNPQGGPHRPLGYFTGCHQQPCLIF